MRLFSTVGQTLIGTLQGATLRKQVGFWYLTQIITAVEEVQDLIPTEYRLGQNYPNPFNPITTIPFAIKEKSHARLTVFNTLGQTVATLVDEELSSGEYEARFSPGGLASGLYIYRLTAKEFVQFRVMLLLK